MRVLTANAGLLARVAPQAGRFINRNILGLQPDPDHWPMPHNAGSLPVHRGITLSDDTGQTLILDHEFTRAWPRRRTAIGAHAFRFEENSEYDCGWRLADVASRFLRRHGTPKFDLAGIVPPPDTFGHVRVLPWVARRLALLLGSSYQSDLFETTCPLAVHPDRVRRPALPLTEMFRIGNASITQLKDARVLLIDWRRHSGKTLLTLARMLHKKGAQVVRFVWLG
jgi:hypothetical protein